MDLFLRTIKDPNNPLHEGKPATFWGQGENDLVVDTNGDFATTEGVDNLNQGAAKILVTEREANVFMPLYGAGLQSLIGQNMDVDYLRAQIKSEVIDALRIYQFINKDNSNLDEQIEMLNSLKVELVGSTGFDVSFRITTRSGKITGSLVQVEG